MEKGTKGSTDYFDSFLAAAVKNPDNRFHFYHAFLKMDFIVLGTVDTNSTEMIDEESPILLKYLDMDAEPVLPVYSSLEKFLTIFPHNQPHLNISAQKLVQLVEPNASLIINPGFDSSKKIIPEEIETLRDRQILAYFFEQLPTEEKQSFLESQMEPLPNNTKSILIENLRRFPSVKKAYLTHLYDPVIDEKPYALVGIEFEPRDEKLDQVVLIQLFEAIRQNASNNQRIEIAILDERLPLTISLVRNSAPFYQQSSQNQLNRMFR